MTADYNGAGYYRLQNFKTQRWASMIDDKGSVDYAGTTADLQAIKLQKNFDEVCSDPASIIYIRPYGSLFNIEAQGTSTQKLMNRYLNMRDAGNGPDGKLYYATGTQSGVEKYVGDGELFPVDVTYAVTSAKNDYRKWYVKPLEEEGKNFFGVKPSVEANGKHYASLFGDFTFKPYSDGVKTYVIKGIHNDMVLMEQVDGVLAKSTPVIVECAGATPSDNRLTIGGDGSAVSGNLLKGVYFCATTVKTHLNYKKFDPATMRVLGACSDGSLGFITPADLEYIPANTFYLPVPAGTPSELRCVDQAEYSAGIDDIIGDQDPDTPVDVYNAAGVIVLRQATQQQIQNLPAGLYIAGKRKILVR